MFSKPICSRRSMLRSLVGGSVLMPALLTEMLHAAELPTNSKALDPLAPKLPHFAAKAKRVIFLFMTGGVSHVDSFDYKPKLIADAGKSIKNNYLKAPSFNFSPRGQSGLMTSDLFPHIASVADDLC